MQRRGWMIVVAALAVGIGGGVVALEVGHGDGCRADLRAAGVGDAAALAYCGCVELSSGAIGPDACEARLGLAAYKAPAAYMRLAGRVLSAPAACSALKASWLRVDSRGWSEKECKTFATCLGADMFIICPLVDTGVEWRCGGGLTAEVRGVASCVEIAHGGAGSHS